MGSAASGRDPVTIPARPRTERCVCRERERAIRPRPRCVSDNKRPREWRRRAAVTPRERVGGSRRAAYRGIRLLRREKNGAGERRASTRGRRRMLCCGVLMGACRAPAKKRLLLCLRRQPTTKACPSVTGRRRLLHPEAQPGRSFRQHAVPTPSPRHGAWPACPSDWFPGREPSSLLVGEGPSARRWPGCGATQSLCSWGKGWDGSDTVPSC